MNKILFRGFHPDNNGATTITLNGKKIKGEWVYGSLITLGKSKYICYADECHDIKDAGALSYGVLPKTVGQWVTTNKDGKDIFEGDIVCHKGYGVGEVKFGEYSFSNCDEYYCWHCGYFAKAKMENRYIDDEDGYPIFLRDGNITVVGNKWEVAEMELVLNKKTIEFEVVGDIKPTIIKHLGYYMTDMLSDCTVHLVGTSAIELPAYCRYLTYRGWCDSDGDTVSKRIIKDLYRQGIIKIHEIRE